MKYRGTLIAVLIVLLLVIVAKFGFNEDFVPEETIVEPTEDFTLKPIENTQFGVLPTGN